MTPPEDDLKESIDRVLRLAIRRRWWILTPIFVITLATICVVLQLPNRYSSEAVLLIVQQQIPQRYVDSSNVITAAEAITSLTREVLSRSRLLGVIEASGLYVEERKSLGPKIVERMKKDIHIELVDQVPGRPDSGAIRVSFTADNPRLAQDVTSRLTALFIEENLKTRETQAALTSKFLSEQLGEAKQKLAEQEQRLRDFKVSNSGELPEQQQANVTTLSGLQMQLQNTMANLSRAQQQRMSLESTLSANLARLQSDRTTLLAQYTARHPTVEKKDQEIEKTQALLSRLRNGSAGTERHQTLAGPDDPMLMQLRAQADANVAEIESLSKDEQRLKVEIARAQSRLNLTPVREQQLSGILRDYDLYRKDYTDLLSKQLHSQLTASLEQQQQGQKFRLVESPTLPFAPSSPARLKISLGAIAAGILIGLVLAFLVDGRDSSFHGEKDLRRHLSLPPLVVGVPLLLTPNEERLRSIRKRLEWVAGFAMMLVVLAAEFYVYKLN